MSRPARHIDYDQVADLLNGIGNPSPAEYSQRLSDSMYVVLGGSERMQGLRSLRRVNCTVVDMTDGKVELGTHMLPGDGWSAASLVHEVFSGVPGRKFSLVVTGIGRDRPDNGKEAEDMIALFDTITEEAGGREPDVVIFSWDGVTVPADFDGDPEEYGQLMHTVRLVDGQEVHRYVVPGAGYAREGTLEELANSPSMCRINR